jgi:hypothetical protein
MSQTTKLITTAGFVCVVLLAVGVVYTLVHKRSTNLTPKTATSGIGCVAKQLAAGSTGNCVNDVQTMVNYIETAGLTECPFPGAQKLPVTGSYDAATQAQVKVAQAWINCYNKEEGITTAINADGNVGSSTWPELCTYAYKFPKLANQSTSPYFQQSLAAGKDAGC